jgi:CheY-like chemotaxis protein
MTAVSPSRSESRDRPTFTLLGDQPDCSEDDPLQFERVATDLTELILASRDRTPFSVGIKGDWGAGKSSLMRRVDRQLKDHKEVVRVWFNAWTSERGDTLEGLIKSVLSELDPNILRRKARSKKFITGVRVITTLGAGLLRSSSVVDALWERASADPKARNQLRDLLDETMTEWLDKTPKGSDSRLLVVFVDDLDRCEPDNVFQVFEAIKLYLDAKGFVFVIGFDENIISEAILEQKKFSKAVTSQLYLDKIVQIEYAVPRPEEKAVRAFLNRLAATSGTDTLVDDPARTLIVQGCDRNPRRLKRFINSFVLAHALVPETAGINPEILIRQLILRTYFQDFVRLYERGADPIDEFYSYLGIRAWIQDEPRENEASDPTLDEVGQFFKEHRMTVPDDRLDLKTPEALNQLEQNLPELYPQLAQNKNFVTLIEALWDKQGQEDVRRWQAERAQEVAAPLTEDVDQSEGPYDLRGLNVLWVDDNPEEARTLAEILKRDGGRVEIAETGDRAFKYLMSGPPIDVLISDINRGDGEDVGFSDLETWREKGLYEGPVVFYAARITPVRRERAASLRARITNDSRELLQWVRGYAPPVRESKIAR